MHAYTVYIQLKKLIIEPTKCHRSIIGTSWVNFRLPSLTSNRWLTIMEVCGFSGLLLCRFFVDQQKMSRLPMDVTSTPFTLALLILSETGFAPSERLDYKI